MLRHILFSFTLLVIVFCPAHAALATPLAAGDINVDGAVNALDIQLVINAALGLSSEFATDMDCDPGHLTDAVDVQLVINAALNLSIDRDGDGLCDAAEGNLGTDPNDPDTDGDGAADGDEVFVLATDPLVPDHAAFVEVPQPLEGDNPTYAVRAVSAPAAGQSVWHPEFHTSEVRITQTPGIRHEYSRFDPFNSDHTRILLLNISTGDWIVYQTQSVPYDTAGNLVATVRLEEPRWDPSEPDMLWGVQEGFRLVRLDVTNAAEPVLVKDFSTDSTIGAILTANPDIYHITMKDEGESSADKRYWAFILQGMNEDYRARYILTWDKNTDSVHYYTLSIGQQYIDWVGMSPNGNWVLVGGAEYNGAPLTGLTMGNRELTETGFHRLDFATAHADVGLDSNGNEVVVMQNVRTDYIDLIPLSTSTQPILEPGGSYEGTNRTPLVRLFYDSGPLGLNSGVHISCNYPGYCVVSTVTEPGVAEQNWLDRKLILVKLNPSHRRAFYLSHIYGTRGDYWEETQATVRNDGSAVIWTTNWNQDVDESKVWEMQLDMPAGWSIP